MARREGKGRKTRLLLGAIADDLTGATDLCNTLVAGGMRTVQVIGVPRAETAVPDADAVVVALKSRTVPPAKAVRESRAALAWLRKGGARQIFFKYCSTFDSTPRGNIGPVADALLDDLAPISPSPARHSRPTGAPSTRDTSSWAMGCLRTRACATIR